MALPPKVGPKSAAIAWHGEGGEFFARHAGEGVEEMVFALGIDDVVKEGAELSAGELKTCIGGGLHDGFEVVALCEKQASPHQKLKVAELGSSTMLGGGVLHCGHTPPRHCMGEGAHPWQ